VAGILHDHRKDSDKEKITPSLARSSHATRQRFKTRHRDPRHSELSILPNRQRSTIAHIEIDVYRKQEKGDMARHGRHWWWWQ